MAESEGFEPPIALRLCLISSQVHSTGLCQLSTWLILHEDGGAKGRFSMQVRRLSVQVEHGFAEVTIDLAELGCRWMGKP